MAGWSLPDWPRAHGVPPARARLRSRPEDFEVEEISGIDLDGAGEHLWLWLEKRNANTEWVARQLARAAACSPGEVGFAGMKDRHALTRQWFSVPWPVARSELLELPDIEGVRLLHQQRHGRKLRRGGLLGNRFRLVLRELEGDPGAIEQRLLAIAKSGVPNYFGPQRFGNGGLNLQRAVSWLERPGRVRRNQRSLHLSVARSFLFNQVLAKRVEHESWNRLLPKEWAMLDGSRSVFYIEVPDEELQLRCEEFDVHPSGPLVGRGTQELAVPEPEQHVMTDYPQLLGGLVAMGAEAARRSLRLRPGDLHWRIETECLQMEFSLPAGAYATTLVRELASTTETVATAAVAQQTDTAGT